LLVYQNVKAEHLETHAVAAVIGLAHSIIVQQLPLHRDKGFDYQVSNSELQQIDFDPALFQSFPDLVQCPLARPSLSDVFICYLEVCSVFVDSVVGQVSE